MPIHLQREIDKLNKTILSLCALVEGNMRQSVQSFTERDTSVARRVIENDEEIDRMEVNVEEECLKILALHQPVAIDLRYIISMLKIDRDLERIGDLAVNIAEYTILLATHPPSQFIRIIRNLPQKVEAMVSDSLNAMMDMDAPVAIKVWRADDEIDSINREFHERADQEISRHPDQWQSILACLAVARCLERIADHAANIAKDVIYLARVKSSAIEGGNLNNHTVRGKP